MKEKKGEILVVLGCLLLISLTVSVAFFMARIEGKGQRVVLKSKDLKISFTESNTLSGTNIEPGWSKTSTFTVKNEGKVTYKYNIGIKDLVNTFVTSGYLQYKITSTDGGYTMSDYMDIPKSSQAKDKTLAYSIEIASNATQTYTVEFRYQNTTEDQSADMGKTLSGTLYIEVGTDKPTIAERILDDNPTISTRTDFSTTFTTTNTGTLYKATESIAGSTAKDVYYFAGDAKNNWVKFGKYETNGPIRGYHSETTPTYREYNSLDECNSASSYNYNCSYAWNAGDPIYWRIVRTNHDGSVKLLYAGTSPDTTSGYIGTSAFNTEIGSPKYAGYMYGEDDSTLDEARTNTNDSTIKTYIDNWYSNNLTSYTKYLSKDAVYCNDRELASGSTYSTSSNFYYAAYTRLSTNNTPSYNCTNIKDAFSGSNVDAKLTYPIGLMTADEISYAGGVSGTSLSSTYAWYYLNSAGGNIAGGWSWGLLSPWAGSKKYNRLWIVSGSGRTDYPSNIQGYDVNYSYAVRPVISLKGDLIWKSGDGSSASPYEVEDLPSTLSEKLLENKTIVTTPRGGAYSTAFTDNTTGTLFQATESIAGSAAKTVYYFAGTPTDNWVKFGGFYWRIIRTNHDGSIRMLYVGKSPDTIEGYIELDSYNYVRGIEANDSPKYVGYMYGEDDSTLDGIRANTKDSTIKETVDKWYSNNIASYTKYLSNDAVYCNDRGLAAGQTWNTSELHFAAYSRLGWEGTDINPTYDCSDSRDAFSVNNTSAKLTYPIGLMTADEIVYAGTGGHRNSADAWYALNSAGKDIADQYVWWNLTPMYFESSAEVAAWGWTIGLDTGGSTYGQNGVRPVISIKSDAIWSSGDGSPENPYEIVYN